MSGNSSQKAEIKDLIKHQKNQKKIKPKNQKKKNQIENSKKNKNK